MCALCIPCASPGRPRHALPNAPPRSVSSDYPMRIGILSEPQRVEGPLFPSSSTSAEHPARDASPACPVPDGEPAQHGLHASDAFSGRVERPLLRPLTPIPCILIHLRTLLHSRNSQLLSL